MYIINYRREIPKISLKMSKGNTEAVKVMLRVRPMNNKEHLLGCKSVIRVYKD